MDNTKPKDITPGPGNYVQEVEIEDIESDFTSSNTKAVENTNDEINKLEKTDELSSDIINQIDDIKSSSLGDEILDLDELNDLDSNDPEFIKGYNESLGLWMTDKILPQKDYAKELELSDFELECLFGKTMYNSKKKEIDTSSILSVANTFKKMGEYLDVYLPMSNVIVRIYEFENDIVLPEFSSILLEDELLAEQTGRREISHDRALLEKIFENSEIISKSSTTSTFDLNNLSNLDMNLLIIAAAKLILISDPNIKDKNTVQLTQQNRCSTCGRPMGVTIDLDKLMRAQYKKIQIEGFKSTYNPDATWEENFKNSYHYKSRKKGATFSKDGIHQIVVQCKDPSYIDVVSREMASLRYLLREYEQIEIVQELVNTSQYKSSSIKNKFSGITEAISSHPFGIRYISRINTDMNIAMALRYIDRVFVRSRDNKDNTKWIIHEAKVVAETPMEELFTLYKSLPKYLKDKVESIIKSFHEYGTDNTIEYEYECTNPKCHAKNKIDLDARGLVFTILSSRSESLESQE